MSCEYSLKRIYSRKLKGGNWVVLAAESDPLVVEEKFEKSLKAWNASGEEYDSETVMILKESGFFIDSDSCNQYMIDEKTSLCWWALKYGLMLLGMCSFVVTLVVTPYIGLPIGSRILSREVNIWVNIAFCIVVSISTTLLHELMHVIFSGAWSSHENRIQFHMKKATAVFSMTHIWVWSFLSRLAALSAGIISDFFILSCLSLMQLFTEHWMLVSASAILWVRILWQFRFHKSCDGKLIAMTIMDNPMIDIDAKYDPLESDEVLLWKRIEKIGYIVDGILIVLWLFPFILSIKTVFS